MNRIKKMREFRRIKQIDLAKAANISQPFLHDLENNRRGAKPETLERIAEVLGCTMNDLFDREEETA